MIRHRRTTPQNFRRAKIFRREPTAAENRLWGKLRNNQLKGVSFRRQHALDPYITDFCAPSKKLIIEVDGSQHLAHVEQDARRSSFLAERGYRILRFWDHEVLKETDAVLLAIAQALDTGE